MDESRLEAVERELKEIKEKLRTPPPKSWYDKLGPVSTLLSSVVLASISLYISSSFQRNQMELQTRIQKSQVLRDFMPYIGDTSTVRTQAAIVAISGLGFDSLAAFVASNVKSPGAENALKTLARNGTSEKIKIYTNASFSYSPYSSWFTVTAPASVKKGAVADISVICKAPMDTSGSLPSSVSISISAGTGIAVAAQDDMSQSISLNGNTWRWRVTAASDADVLFLPMRISVTKSGTTTRYTRYISINVEKSFLTSLWEYVRATPSTWAGLVLAIYLALSGIRRLFR